MTRKGNRLTDKIRLLIIAIQQEENDLLIQRQQENAKSSTDFNNAFGTLLACMVILLLVVFFTVRANFSARIRAEKEIIQINRELERKISQVKENEAKFSKIFDVNPVGITISRLSSGIMIDANTSLQKMYGYTREEIIGRTAVELNMVDSEVRETLIREMVHGGRIRNRNSWCAISSKPCSPFCFRSIHSTSRVNNLSLLFRMI